MTTTIEIQGIQVVLGVNGGLPILYEELTGRDYFIDTMRISRYNPDELDFSFKEIHSIIWVMACLAGYRGTMMQFYSQFPMPIDTFSTWKVAQELIHGDSETKKQ